MKRELRILLCAAATSSAVLAGGCQKSDLEKEGVIRSGWGMMIADGPPGGHPPEVFALAIVKLNEDLIPKSSLGPKMEVLLVPRLSGYYTVVLAKHRVTDSEKKLIDELVATAFQNAREELTEFEKKARR